MQESVGHYKILDRAGTGRIGEIYRARDTKHGRTVAIQVLAPDIAGEPEKRQRFLQEARAAAVLSHPNIAMLYEVGDENGLVFLACEFVPGEPLTKIVANRSLSPRRAVDFATQLADAIADAHAEGIAHGDLRSDVVTVTPKDKVKVLDFGLARWRKDAMVPPAEPSEADYRADLSALGVVLYEMFTGQPPSTAVPAPPSSVNPHLPNELDPIALKALSKSDQAGYESAATLAAELRSVGAILDVRSGEKEPPALAPARPRRSSIRTPLLGVLILAVIAVLIWYAMRNG